jgi:hypothetical protein
MQPTGTDWMDRFDNYDKYKNPGESKEDYSRRVGWEFQKEQLGLAGTYASKFAGGAASVPGPPPIKIGAGIINSMLPSGEAAVNAGSGIAQQGLDKVFDALPIPAGGKAAARGLWGAFSFLGTNKAARTGVNKVDPTTDPDLGITDYLISSIPIVGELGAGMLKQALKNTTEFNALAEKLHLPVRLDPKTRQLMRLEMNTVDSSAKALAEGPVDTTRNLMKAEADAALAATAAGRNAAEVKRSVGTIKGQVGTSAKAAAEAKAAHQAKVVTTVNDYNAHVDDQISTIKAEMQALEESADETKVLAKAQQMTGGDVDMVRQQTKAQVNLTTIARRERVLNLNMRTMKKGSQEWVDANEELKRLAMAKESVSNQLTKAQGTAKEGQLATDADKVLDQQTLTEELRKRQDEITAWEKTRNNYTRRAKTGDEKWLANVGGEVQSTHRWYMKEAEAQRAWERSLDDAKIVQADAQDAMQKTHEFAKGLSADVTQYLDSNLGAMGGSLKKAMDAGDSEKVLDILWRDKMAQGTANPGNPNSVSATIAAIRNSWKDLPVEAREMKDLTLRQAFFRDLLMAKSSRKVGSMFPDNIAQTLHNLDNSGGVDTLKTILDDGSRTAKQLEGDVKAFMDVTGEMFKRANKGKGWSTLHNWFIIDSLAHVTGYSTALAATAIGATLLRKINTEDILSAAVKDPRAILTALKKLEMAGTRGITQKMKAAQNLMYLVTGYNKVAPKETGMEMTEERFTAKQGQEALKAVPKSNSGKVTTPAPQSTEELQKLLDEPIQP